MNLNIDNSRSYATEERLDRALRQYGLDRVSSLTVRNRDGRWTAVFTRDRLRMADVALIAPAQRGFMVVS